MTGKAEHKGTDVIIVHKVSIDSCISGEIERLNNDNNVLTLSSCCGHGDVGYIIVCGSDIQKMSELGYKTTTIKYLDHDIISDDTMVLCAFKPKSKCNCKT
jgi:hypothetical protein